MGQQKTIQYVVKVSKYCNLRCTYCYEYAELGNRTRIGLGELRRFFEHAAAHLADSKFGRAEFVWHGGEPFLIELDYYAAVREMQREIFGERARYINSVQTNLTVLTPRHVEFLQNGEFFDEVGVSFDVYGDQRVDTKGKLRTDRILANIQTLIDHEFEFGAIAVLAQNTLPEARRIYRFYDELQIAVRFLPFYRSADEAQAGRHGVTCDQLVTACKAIFEEWCTSERSTPAEPINEYLDFAVSYLNNDPKRFYDKQGDESVFVVDVDGSTWGVAETYDQSYRYGNVFNDQLSVLLGSAGRQSAVRDARARMEKHCASCRFFGHCPGDFVGDATLQQQSMLSESGCPVAKLLPHMIATLETSGLGEDIREARKSPLHRNMTAGAGL